MKYPAAMYNLDNRTANTGRKSVGQRKLAAVAFRHTIVYRSVTIDIIGYENNIRRVLSKNTDLFADSFAGL